MNYGTNDNSKIYYSSREISSELNIPIYQVGRWQKRFKIEKKKNRAGKQTFQVKEFDQFREIKALLDEGALSDSEILMKINSLEQNTLIKHEKTVESKDVKDIKIALSLLNPKVPKEKAPLIGNDRLKIAQDLQEVLNILKS